MTENILLNLSSKQDLLPQFEKINVSEVEDALNTILKNAKDTIELLATSSDEPTWDNFVHPMEEADEKLSQFWSAISHLDAVKNSDELRDVVQACLPKLSNYGTEISQDVRLFNKFNAIFQGDEYSTLSVSKRKIIDNAIRDFKLSGVNLEEDKKHRLKEIQQQLSELSHKFSNNVLDSTQAWTLDITDESDLSGLPESAKAMAKQFAEKAGIDGYRITLDAPSFIPFLTYADNAELRETLYRKYVTRASDLYTDESASFDGRQWDNAELMSNILKLRQEKAQIVGQKTYADYSLVPKMAETPQQVVDFLVNLAEKSKPAALNDYQELVDFAKNKFGIEKLNAWDLSYYSEKLRQDLYDFTEEEVKPYFAAENVINGMFEITGTLFGLSFKKIETPHIWHEDVHYYQLFDESSKSQIGGFYLDLYARAKKRGGAWMADCVSRKSTNNGVQKPVAFLTCNFTPPVNDQPALLTHNEVTTLFHEFGHGLHHLLTEVDELGVSGISGVAWDAVELPSQFLENWCWEREGLDIFAKHFETGASLPDELLEKMKKAKNFQSAMGMVRQLEFSLFDMKIHQNIDINSAEQIQATLDEVRQQVAVIKAPEFNRFQNGFSHIFAGGYAAGYYSYKWAEVLSADAFSKFEEDGILNTETGMCFRKTVLANGGSQHPMDLFKAFRGREPKIDALLRHSGLQA